MDIVILTCFTAYEARVKYIKSFFEKQGKKTAVITTNFIHREKKYRTSAPSGYLQIDTKSYEKNLSLKRLYSHYSFAYEAIDTVKELRPLILYVLVPANSLLKVCALYKKKYKCILIVDIIDLWPESLPIKISKRLWPLSLWATLRDNYLCEADLVITECDLFAEKLQLQLKGIFNRTVYWPQKSYPCILPEIANEPLCFLYLGSINNIIDIDSIVGLLKATYKKTNETVIHIIGDGEKRTYFLDCLQKNNLTFKYHGLIYEHVEIQEIASNCHFGINMMKSDVVVGLTMKSTAYLELGLPLINNLKGDTWEKINQYQIGINVSNDFSSVLQCRPEEIGKMRRNARKFFEEYLSEQAFSKEFDLALKQLKNINDKRI